MTTSPSRALARSAFGAVAVFPATVVALNVVQLGDGYDAGRQAISELALGRAGSMMTLAFCALAAGTFLLALVLRRTGGMVPAALLACAAPLSLVSAVFRTDPSGALPTAHGRVHDAAGITTFVLMLAAMAFCSVRFSRDRRWRRLAVPTCVLAVTGLVGFFLVPVLGDRHFGLAQRVLIGSFITWMLVTAAGSPDQVASDPTARVRPRVHV